MAEQSYSRLLYAKCCEDIVAGREFMLPVGLGRGGLERTQQPVFIDALPGEKASNIWWLTEFRVVIEEAVEAGLIENAIVHGSYGDFTFTNFSDLELTLVLTELSEMAMVNKTALKDWLRRRLNPFLLRVDPLQHHGVFYLWKDLLKRYSQQILPVVCYESAWSYRPVTIDFFIDSKESIEEPLPLKQTLKALKNIESHFFRFGRSAYAVKRLISNVLLLPAFFFQSKGRMLTKPEAIELLVAEMGLEASEVVNLASELRNFWPRSPAWLYYVRRLVVDVRIPAGKIDARILSLYQLNDELMSQVDLLQRKLPGFCARIEEKI